MRSAAVKAGIELGLDRMGSFRVDAVPDVRRHRLEALLRILWLEGYLNRSSEGYRASSTWTMLEGIAEEGWGKMATCFLQDTVLPVESEEAYHSAIFDLAVADSCQLWRDLPRSRPSPKHGSGVDLELLRPIPTKLEHDGGTSSHVLWRDHRAGTLLDLGAGMGGYSHGFLLSNEAHRVVVVDTAPCIQLARRRLDAWGDRVTFMQGDLLQPRQGRYPLVLLANVLHLYGFKDARRIVEHAWDAVQPGGRLIIRDEWLHRDVNCISAADYFNLNLALYTDEGRCHRVDRLERLVQSIVGRSVGAVRDGARVSLIVTKDAEG